MDARRRRWIAALAVYLTWVAALATLAVASGRRPPQRHRPPAPVAAPR